MKTSNILAAYRNAATPAARLAAWQSTHPARNLHKIRERVAAKWSGENTLATARRALIQSKGPELSTPESDTPYLWVTDSSPEVLASWAGREFLTHRGWYADQWQDETLETYAVRLTRFPRLMFYAVKDSCNGDLRVHLDEWEEIFHGCGHDYVNADDAIRDSARSVIRSNDSNTERQAEESREYYERDAKEREIEENRGRLKQLRTDIRALAGELKRLCPSPLATDYPAAAKSLRSSLAGLLAERSRLMRENADIAASL